MIDIDHTDIRELRCVGGGWSASWDARRETVVFNYGDGSRRTDSIQLRLDYFRHFQQDFDTSEKELKKIIAHWPKAGPEELSVSWTLPFERLAFFYVQLLIQRGGDILPSAGLLMDWLLLANNTAPWLHRFDQKLSYASRFRLLSLAISELLALRDERKDHLLEIDATDQETREHYWFTVRMYFELADEWSKAEGMSSLDASKAFTQSCLTYLEILKDEPYRREFDAFLHNQGSSIESEVARVLEIEPEKGPGRQHKGMDRMRDQRGTDEAVQRIFFSWFLQRYDLRSARILMMRSMTSGELNWSLACLIFTLFATYLFFLQVIHSSIIIPVYHHAAFTLSDQTLWLVQVFMQGMALFIAALAAPTLFNLILPRALFGSLLTWITLVFTSIPGLWAIEFEGNGNPGSGGKTNLAFVCHRFLRDNNYYSLLAALPCFLLGLVFIMREISQWTKRKRTILRRAWNTALRLYLGSLFWSMIFATPIRYCLERPRDPSCFCLLPIACVGASLAALFGIIVELVWEDKSIAEPLEEPL